MCDMVSCKSLGHVYVCSLLLMNTNTLPKSKKSTHDFHYKKRYDSILLSFIDVERRKKLSMYYGSTRPKRQKPDGPADQCYIYV